MCVAGESSWGYTPAGLSRLFLHGITFPNTNPHYPIIIYKKKTVQNEYTNIIEISSPEENDSVLFNELLWNKK